MGKIAEQVATPGTLSDTASETATPHKVEMNKDVSEKYPSPDSGDGEMPAPPPKQQRDSAAPESLMSALSSSSPASAATSSTTKSASRAMLTLKASKKRKADAEAHDDPTELPDRQTTAPPTKRRKAGERAHDASAGANISASKAFGAKKRKADEVTPDNPSETSPPGPPAKKKKATPKKPKQPTKTSPRKRTAKAEPPKDNEATQLMPPPPKPLTKAVANKVAQVHRFATETHLSEPSKLNRDAQNPNLVSIPESSLLSAIIRMRTHYEIRGQNSQATIEEAVVERFKRSMPSGEVDFVVVDVAKDTQFERDIKAKIARHGLEGVNLLEMELEMSVRDSARQMGIPPPLEDEEVQAGRRFYELFRKVWDKVVAEEEEKRIWKGDLGVHEEESGAAEEQELGIKDGKAGEAGAQKKRVVVDKTASVEGVLEAGSKETKTATAVDNASCRKETKGDSEVERAGVSVAPMQDV